MSALITRDERERWRASVRGNRVTINGVDFGKAMLRLLDALDAADAMADELPHLRGAMERAALHNCADNPEYFEEEARHCDNVLAPYQALVEPPK